MEHPYPFEGPRTSHRIAILLVAILPFLATGVAIWMLWGSSVTWLDLGLMVGFYLLAGMGISLGLHRMLTHGAFKAKAPVRAALIFAAMQSIEGGPATWAATHRRHHAYADREGDPHSPLDGLLHSHFGWMMRGNLVRSGRAYEQLMEDPVVRFFERTQAIWYASAFILPGLIALAVTGTFVGFLHGAIWGGAVRVFLLHHATWAVNSIGHVFGTRPYEAPDASRNNLALGLVSFGEGWHNNHHAFPSSAYIGHRWYQVDPGRYVVAVLKWLRLITHVRIPTKEERRARLRSMARKTPGSAKARPAPEA